MRTWWLCLKLKPKGLIIYFCEVNTFIGDFSHASFVIMPEWFSTTSGGIFQTCIV